MWRSLKENQLNNAIRREHPKKTFFQDVVLSSGPKPPPVFKTQNVTFLSSKIHCKKQPTKLLHMHNELITLSFSTHFLL